MKLRGVTTGLCFFLAVSLPVATASDHEPSDRFRQIKTVYVKPVNSENGDAPFEAAAETRKVLTESGCLKVADRPEAADAILEISSDRDGNWIRYPFGGRRVSASAVLLDRTTGSALWTNDRSSRWLPSPSYAGRVIAHALIDAHGCETEASTWEPFKNLKSKQSPPAGDAAKEATNDAPAENASDATSAASSKPAKVVQRGMTFAQVEAVLGPPVARANLGEKVLYKYKDLSVEFHNGKVTDVR